MIDMKELTKLRAWNKKIEKEQAKNLKVYELEEELNHLRKLKYFEDNPWIFYVFSVIAFVLIFVAIIYLACEVNVI